ncbi:helix-turn-helix domain-containing protein [Cohnella lupini]|uniref:Two-component system response regulator YesN n=1 Tax=Cohnella lupini TaxID=1294267 RepID=A0A3D9HUK9_9BACL|nr:helix-turn-helix domain-containing protein [Cohnella lupini]RED53157.1 two-component system response regulator YesN [Cohnella lupini]
MKPVKVMIVDDEILAIEHIRRLVPWQLLGYEIVCTTTNPSKAPELAREYHADLAILDIVMPGMDGLELCRQLAAQGTVSRIVLLTSYKEFEYAKEAVKLGVSNYWVKHELDAETLKRELGGLRQEIENVRRQRDGDLSRLLVDWLGGRPITDGQWRTLAGAGNNGEPSGALHLVVLQSDRPYPLMSGITSDELPNGLELPMDWPEGGSREWMFAVRFLDSHFVLIGADESSRGEGKLRELLEDKAVSARRVMERMTGVTATMAIAYGIRDRTEVPGKVAEAMRWLSRSVFYGPRHTFRLNEIRQEDISAHSWAWEEGVSRIRDALSAFRLEDAMRELKELFGQAAEARDITGFSYLCRQLAAALNRVRTSVHRPSLAEAWSSGQIDSSGWSSLDGIQAWFAAELDVLHASNSVQSVMSRKVRQALDYMEKHYADASVDTDTVARQLGISRDYLRHMFKEETGQTVLDRLTDIRMERASAMLDDGKLKVYEIAERVGFRNSQYFSQVFRKSKGMSPLEYTERQR